MLRLLNVLARVLAAFAFPVFLIFSLACQVEVDTRAIKSLGVDMVTVDRSRLWSNSAASLPDLNSLRENFMARTLNFFCGSSVTVSLSVLKESEEAILLMSFGLIAGSGASGFPWKRVKWGLYP